MMRLLRETQLPIGNSTKLVLLSEIIGVEMGNMAVLPGKSQFEAIFWALFADFDKSIRSKSNRFLAAAISQLDVFRLNFMPVIDPGIAKSVQHRAPHFSR